MRLLTSASHSVTRTAYVSTGADDTYARLIDKKLTPVLARLTAPHWWTWWRSLGPRMLHATP